MDGGLGPFAGGIHRRGIALDDRPVKGVLHVRLRVGRRRRAASRLVSFSVKSSSGGRSAVRSLGLQRVPPERRCARPRMPAGPLRRMLGLGPVALALAAPAPGVAEPERRQQVHRRGLGAAVGHGDADQDVVGRRPWRTRRRRRSSGRRRRRRCRPARTRGPTCRARGSPGPAARRETRPADTCRAP